MIFFKDIFVLLVVFEASLTLWNFPENLPRLQTLFNLFINFLYFSSVFLWPILMNSVLQASSKILPSFNQASNTLQPIYPTSPLNPTSPPNTIPDHTL
jgi:hypothetical protein